MMAALFYGAGKGREGSRRIVLTIWSATGSEQQPRGLFKDAISIDGIFKQTQIRSRRRISFQTLEGGRVAADASPLFKPLNHR